MINPVTNHTMKKTCRKCGIDKPIEDFGHLSKMKDGFNTMCKACVSVYGRVWRKSNAGKSRAYQQTYKIAHPDRVAHKPNSDREYVKRFNNAKLASIKLQKGICPGCGRDFSSCPNFALLICFQKSHLHSRKCAYHLRSDQEFFWSCLGCNVGKQFKKCGHWESPGHFNETCIIGS